MDILRVLQASDLEVRRKTLDLAMDLVTSRNVGEVSQCDYIMDIKRGFCMNEHFPLSLDV